MVTFSPRAIMPHFEVVISGGRLPMFRTAIAFAALACAGNALAQSTSTTMDMGGGMTHVDTMGPNGAMSSSNCTNIGGSMTSCQTMDMSQPQHTYPTPDMSRPQRTYTRPDISEPEPSYAAPYVSRLPMPASAVPLPAAIGRTAAVASPALAVATKDVAITPTPMALVSSTLIRKGAPDWNYGDALFVGSSDRNGRWFSKEGDVEYAVSYLGHTFSLVGPKNMTIEDIRATFDQEWRDNPWVWYSSTNAGTVEYFSIKSQRRYSDRIEVWTKADHSKDRTEKARDTKELYEIRCDEQTIRSLQFISHDASGNVISLRDYPRSASRVIPDTVGSALVDEMCKVIS